MKATSQTILSHDDIKNKIRRIAYQIYESNVNEKVVILAGIHKNGYLLAQRLKTILDDVSDLQCVLCKVTMDKNKPLGTVETSMPASAYTNKSVVLIDDVLNSGTTLIYGVKFFLEVPLKRFKTAVLVNRNHKKYPVKADFKGISLSTSLHENVKVRLSSTNDTAILE